jgi:hypothetical protein
METITTNSDMSSIVKIKKIKKQKCLNIENYEIIDEPTLDIIENSSCVSEIKQKGICWIENILKQKVTYTKPGSISYLLYGEKPSEQSINVKLGRLGEFISKELIKTNNNLELLNCGIQMIDDRKKDVDLKFKDEVKKIIYYRELKGNIELDTEKLPATIKKCKDIETDLKNKNVDYSIDCGILNWSVYNRKILTAGLSNIKTFEKGGIKIDHMEEFLQIIGVVWDEQDYYSYFREIGTKMRTIFE